MTRVFGRGRTIGALARLFALPLAVLVAALSSAAPAFASYKVRLDYVRTAPGNQPGVFFATENVSGAGSTPVLSHGVTNLTLGGSPSPAQVRVTVLSGAVVMTMPSAAPSGGETKGIRLQVGDEKYIPVDNGQVIAFTEAADGPSSSGGASGAGFPADQPNTGAINAATANAAYSVSLANGEGVIGFKVSGLTASGATLTVEGSNDGGATWSAINTTAPGSGALSTTVAADGQFRVNGAGHTNVRLRVSGTGAGTISVASNASTVAGLVGLSAPLPAGSNLVGKVAGSNGGALNTDAANSLITSDGITVTGSPFSIASNGSTTSPFSTIGYGTIVVQFTSVGGGFGGFLQETLDPTCTTGWVNIPFYPASGGAPFVVPATNGQAGSGGLFVGPAYGLCARVQIGSGAPASFNVSLLRDRLNVPISGALFTQPISGSVNVTQGFTDSTTALGASATFTGTARAMNAIGTSPSWYGATACSDQSGTLQLQESLDTGATWQTVASTAVAAGQCGDISIRVRGASASSVEYRDQYVNGSTPQTTFRLSSSFTAN